MGEIVPDAIEGYLAGLNRAGDTVLDEIAAGNTTRGLPLIDAEVGALLRVLATSIQATRILEIGTAIGYSGIWLARALPPGGMLVTMEFDEGRAREARANVERAGLSDRVSIVVGDAQLKLAKVSGPFDLIFQDGDKKLYTPLLDRLVALLRPGGLPELKPILETLAKATTVLRAADFNDDASGGQQSSVATAPSAGPGSEMRR